MAKYFFYEFYIIMVNNISSKPVSVFSAFNTVYDRQSAPVRVAMIDDFEKKYIRIDADLKPDMTHGDVVELFLRSGLPGAEITKLNTNINEVSVKNALLSIMKGGVKYDALNISKSSDISYKELSKIAGTQITPGNIKEKKAEVKSKLFASGYPEASYLKTINECLEKLVKSGTKVYVAAGNKGKKSLNIYTLAEGVTVTGAVNENNKPARFSSDNTLVNRFEKGIFKIKQAKDSKGKGFDITQDGKPDIYENETTSRFKYPLFNLSGTSFAAPQALIKDLKGKNS